MSAAKGSNGIKDGQLYEQAFVDWLTNVDDFKP